jgi:prepilin-type N-terminal cleavage/methylation domain-containing protein
MPMSGRIRDSRRGAGNHIRKLGYASGFTLLEVLVTMVVMAAITTLLMQGYLQILDKKQRFLDAVESIEVDDLQEHWFRTTVGGIHFALPDDEFQFIGTTARMSGVTLTPLVGRAGTPTYFEWKLEEDGQFRKLTYIEEGGAHWSVYTCRGSCGFKYRNLVGDWRDSWQPVLDRGIRARVQNDTMARYLPEAALFFDQMAEDSISWIVPVMGRKTARWYLSEEY